MALTANLPGVRRPGHLGYFHMKNEEKFKTWLTDHGAIVLPPTNPWEVVRFRTVNGVSVIYTNKRGYLTFTGESEKAHRAFETGNTWRAVDRKRKALRSLKAKLATRDGKRCWFDGIGRDFDELTIEHLVSVSHGGTDHPDNLVLACEPCNRAVANLPVSKKVEYRDRKLKESRDVPA